VNRIWEMNLGEERVCQVLKAIGWEFDLVTWRWPT
jgi:hypothetical protein